MNSTGGMSPTELGDVLKPLLLKDLRTNCRARNLNPGGSRESLFERLKENMLDTQDYSLVEEDGQKKASVDQARALQPNGAATGNNYYRSEGQNVGNFMTDRPSSRVLAPPGGGSQISFGAESAPMPHSQGQVGQADKGTSLFMGGGSPNSGSNNYSRPSGQNVGNFLTDRSSSRILAPPGGASQISFG